MPYIGKPSDQGEMGRPLLERTMEDSNKGCEFTRRKETKTRNSDQRSFLYDLSTKCLVRTAYGMISRVKVPIQETVDMSNMVMMTRDISRSNDNQY
jgi:hypothetical protein